MTTDLATRLAALYETVKLNPGMVATAQQQRDRGILEALNDIVLRLEAIEAAAVERDTIDAAMDRVALAMHNRLRAIEATMVENDKSLESLDSVVMDFLQRISAIEAWKETQTGDGK